MSSSYLVEVYKTKAIGYIREYRNGHGSSPVIWDYLAKKYLSWDAYYKIPPNDMDQLWQLYKKLDIPMHLRMCLGLTYDYAYVSKKNLKQMAEYVRLAARDVHEEFNGGRVIHWHQIATDLAEIADSKTDYRLRGIALEGTSVCDIWTTSKPETLADRAFEVFDFVKDADKKEAA